MCGLFLRTGARMTEATHEQHTTAWLLDRVKVGDTQARSALVERVEPLLRRFARGRLPGRLRSQEDTADLVQLTWLKVLDKLETIDAGEPGAFFAYLRTVLINALRESLRRNARSPIDQGRDPDLVASNVDIDDWLVWEQSLAILSPEHRGLVLMRFEFGMSFAEIASELGESSDGVRMKINRAIARMAGAAHADAD
jgi:RNA polymerase sigma factor (sigma-70 family)